MNSKNLKNFKRVLFCKDFHITGNGDDKVWAKTEWTHMEKLDSGGKDYLSRFKILCSETGIYVLFNGEDDLLTTFDNPDFTKIFQADVFELFFHPDPSAPCYFEYQINALNKELILFAINRQGEISTYTPWPYESNKVEKSVYVLGDKLPGAKILGWSAEVFIPFKLLSSINNCPPKHGEVWKANFCRLDYDSGNMIKWAWAPIDTSFHELDRYYNLVFH